uniref:Uncharacterized protein n=2 Tax=Gopherus TaxID=38771 RepID=A0A8C4YVK9_9SAUR
MPLAQLGDPWPNMELVQLDTEVRRGRRTGNLGGSGIQPPRTLLAPGCWGPCRGGGSPLL